ncbi:MAG: HAMP domain-containing histidine kinase [Flavobacteriales bacterium]|nr:HAMP domain-containing histidine kinase [Flavobacteriales bacterium]
MNAITQRRSRPGRLLALLWILAAYIFFQICWWGFQLIKLHHEILELRSVVLGQSQLSFYTSKVWMVVGEGSVFIVLLVLGFAYILRIYRKEVRLAGMEKTFLLSVTHELKTPVAAVKLQLETLNSPGLTESQREKLTQTALRETRRLQDLTENILLATRLDNLHLSLHKEVFSLMDVIEHEAERYRSIHHMNLVVNIGANMKMSGDFQMITALISNLLDNAHKYGGGKPVTIALKRHNNDVVISVADLGQGIPDDEKQKIFSRFYRIGNEDTRTSKGTGLGLFICATVVKLHHGVITVKDNQPNGSIFVITFPAQAI